MIKPIKELNCMIDILIKAGGFILIIMLGFALKTKGVCTREHGSFLSTIIMNITLPCSLLSSINNQYYLFICVLYILTTNKQIQKKCTKTICSCLYYRYISIDYEKSFFLTLTYFCNILICSFIVF